MGGQRPPQNYFHAILGLAIIALAAYQVHYGIVTEWIHSTGDGTIVPQKAMNAWIALTVVSAASRLIVRLIVGCEGAYIVLCLLLDLLVSLCDWSCVASSAIRSGSGGQEGGCGQWRDGEGIVLENELARIAPHSFYFTFALPRLFYLPRVSLTLQ